MSDTPHKDEISSNPAAPFRIDMDINPEKMAVRIRLRGPRNPGVDFDSIVELLNDHGIIFGVDTTSILKLIERYESASSGEVIDEVVARGNPPIPGQPGRVEILVKESEQVTIDETGRADFRNVERYRTVEKGQTVARVIPGVPGKPGTNIYGEEVVPSSVDTPALKAGNNIEIIPGTHDYISQVHGIFSYKKDTIEVNPVLVIPGSVGIESGNVNYDGSVQVGQNIDRGSSVHVEGNLVVGGAVESGDIKVGGDITVKKGVNTKRDGIIRVTGILKAVYIDNSKISADQGVIVDKSIISTHIVTHGDLSLTGKGSTISGGELYVYGSIAADVIGNKTETPTKLVIGDHFQNRMYLELHSKELEAKQKEYEKIAEKIAKIKIYVQRSRGNIPVEKKADFRVVFQDYKEITDKIKKLEELVQFYRSNRYNKNSVQITAREIIHPGVEIHYRNMVEKIKAPLSSCILTFAPGMEKPTMDAFRR